MTMVMLIKFFESTICALHSLLVYLFVKCLLVILLKNQSSSLCKAGSTTEVKMSKEDLEAEEERRADRESVSKA